MQYIALEISKEQIMYAVKQNTYTAGESIKEGQMLRMATKTQADSDDEDLLSTYVNSAFYRLMDVLKPLLTGFEVNAEIGKFEIKLSLPDTFDTNQISTMQSAIVDYLIYSAMGNWYILTWPERAGVWLEKAEVALRLLIQRTNQRTGPIRRPHQPLC